MSDNTTISKKRVISEEQKLKMKEAAKIAREKRDAEEEANPELKDKRLAAMKAKRDAKKAAKEANNTGVVEEKPPKAKRPSWWSTATEEQKQAAKDKAKAKREAKDKEFKILQ